MPKVFGQTGPSVFNNEIKALITDYFDACPLYITQDRPGDLEWVIKNIDALVLGGGNDIHPMIYRENVTRFDNFSKFDLCRDKRELLLIDACIKAKKPILAICRGMQIVCVRFGFPLCADISHGDIAHSPGEIKINYECGENLHYIECLAEFKEKYFKDEEGSLSFHHQAILFFKQHRELNGINVVGIAPTCTNKQKNNDIVEIIESEKFKIVGYQGHPELDWQYGNVVSNKVLERFKEMLE